MVSEEQKARDTGVQFKEHMEVVPASDQLKPVKNWCLQQSLEEEVGRPGVEEAYKSSDA